MTLFIWFGGGRWGQAVKPILCTATAVKKQYKWDIGTCLTCYKIYILENYCIWQFNSMKIISGDCCLFHAHYHWWPQLQCCWRWWAIHLGWKQVGASQVQSTQFWGLWFCHPQAGQTCHSSLFHSGPCLPSLWSFSNFWRSHSDHQVFTSTSIL